jgi:hypothetical protein
MPPPPPPAGAPAPPTPPVLTIHGSGPDVKLIYVDSTKVEFMGPNGGNIVVFKAEKAGNSAASPGEKSGIVLKPAVNLPKEKPLIVIDGVITSELNLNDLNPSNIQSMNVMKGEKAKEKYAEKGANGVIEITTKKP